MARSASTTARKPVHVDEGIMSTLPMTVEAVAADEATISQLFVVVGKSAQTIRENNRKAAEMVLQHRRRFLAPEKTQKALGAENAPDLFGASDAYKASWTSIQSSARSRLVKAWVTKGMDPQVAEATAKADMETVRKAVSNHVRRLVDGGLNPETGLTAAQLSAYGFKYNSTLGDDQALPPTADTPRKPPANEPTDTENALAVDLADPVAIMLAVTPLLNRCLTLQPVEGQDPIATEKTWRALSATVVGIGRQLGYLAPARTPQDARDGN